MGRVFKDLRRVFKDSHRVVKDSNLQKALEALSEHTGMQQKLIFVPRYRSTSGMASADINRDYWQDSVEN